MSAAEVIAKIRSLPKEEQNKVAEFVFRELGPGDVKVGRKKSFEQASKEVFSEYRELLTRLAQ